MIYNLNGPVVIALTSKSDAQSSSHTRILKKFSLPGISLLFIDPKYLLTQKPPSPPPFPAVACRNVKSKKQKVGSTIC